MHLGKTSTACHPEGPNTRACYLVRDELARSRERERADGSRTVRSLTLAATGAPARKTRVYWQCSEGPHKQCPTLLSKPTPHDV